MTHKDFEIVLNRRIEKIMNVLAKKAQEYSFSDDRLHNFKRAAAMQATTPEKALIGMLAKHMVSIMDMVDDIQRGKYHGIPAWDEKIGDAVNYLLLLEGLIDERNNK